jgi:hypothetical protein
MERRDGELVLREAQLISEEKVPEYTNAPRPDDYSKCQP